MSSASRFKHRGKQEGSPLLLLEKTSLRAGARCSPRLSPPTGRGGCSSGVRLRHQAPAAQQTLRQIGESPNAAGHRAQPLPFAGSSPKLITPSSPALARTPGAAVQRRSPPCPSARELGARHTGLTPIQTAVPAPLLPLPRGSGSTTRTEGPWETPRAAHVRRGTGLGLDLRPWRMLVCAGSIQGQSELWSCLHDTLKQSSHCAWSSESQSPIKLPPRTVKTLSKLVTNGKYLAPAPL